MLKRTDLENAFTDVCMDLDALRRTGLDLPGLHRCTREIDFAVGSLCDALARPTTEDITACAQRAYRAVLGACELLESATSDDRRTQQKLELAYAAASALLDELEPLVGRDERRRRDVLLGELPLEPGWRRS